MSPSPFRWSLWLPRLVLVLAAVAAVAWLARLDYGRAITTNVVDLLPADEREPEVQWLRRLVDDAQGRSLWFVLTGAAGGAPTAHAVDAFVEDLAGGDAVTDVVRVDEGDGARQLAEHVFNHRLTLLLPGWLAERQNAFAATARPVEDWPQWLANEAAAALDDFLARPESAAFEDLLASDPLLLLPTAAANASMLVAATASTPEAPALIWATSRDGPLSEAGQEPVFTQVERAIAAARHHEPQVAVQWSGVHRFAAASKSRIRAEFAWLNPVALLAVLTVTALLVRRPWRVLHLLPVVLLALLGAWTVTTLAFERIHILVFVLGALLTGAAIDYGFHVSVHQDRTRPAGFGRLRPVLKPLVGSCLTTVVGFSVLWWAELPMLRQLGVFVTAGLLAALGAALLYFGHFTNEPIEARRIHTGRRPRGLLITAAGLALLASLGLIRLQWHDDIRELEVPTADLQANDRQVRQWFGDQTGRSAYLVRGRDLVEARTRLENLSEWHQQQFDQPMASIGQVWPTPAHYEQAPSWLAALTEFPEAFRAALINRGYSVDEFEPFFSTWQERSEQPWPEYARVVDDVVGRLTGPLGHLAGAADGQAWVLALAEHPPGETPPAELGVMELNQLQTLNRVFTRYRTQAAQLSLVGLVVVVIIVLALYGPRRAARILVIPAAACVISFGALGWLGQPLNLFHLLGAFLGLCLSHDYAIFATEPRDDAAPPPASIRLAALTTAASFGVLTFSRIPVISSLGITVTLIVLVALSWVELTPARRPSS
jgi:predicted exporter